MERRGGFLGCDGVQSLVFDADAIFHADAM